MIALSNGRLLKKRVITLQRFDPAAVQSAVGLILSSDNVSFLSWGTKRLRLDGGITVFPSITRKLSRTHIFDQYIAKIASVSSGPCPISKALFFQIIGMITADEAKIIKSVDYVVGFLVNDSFHILLRILEGDNGLNDDNRSHLVVELEAVRSYLKYGFDSRLRCDSGEPCLLHHIPFGLVPNQGDSLAASSICGDCRFLFGFFSRLKAALVSCNEAAATLRVVDDCALKVKLFLGHRVRVINQQLAIRKQIEEMKQRCLENCGSDEAVLTIDFKMKLEPLYFREKTVEHYGKRGISLHGCMVQYFTFNSDGGGNAANHDYPSVNDQRLYFDHISEGDNKQDRESVMSVLEAIFLWLKKDLPHIKKVILLSDNAACYQNMLPPLVLPLLGFACGIQVTRFMHTETQDGKSPLDAHFARSMQVLVGWVKENNNYITPTQVVVGLKSHGGLPNCC